MYRAPPVMLSHGGQAIAQPPYVPYPQGFYQPQYHQQQQQLILQQQIQHSMMQAAAHQQQQPGSQQQIGQIRTIPGPPMQPQQAQPPTVNQYPQVALSSIVSQAPMNAGYYYQPAQLQQPPVRPQPQQASGPKTRPNALQFFDPDTKAPIDLTAKLPETSKPAKKPEEIAPEVRFV